MQKWLRALIAAWGARKLGGGCLTTVLIFFLIYYALGQCNHVQTGHAKVREHSTPVVALREK